MSTLGEVLGRLLERGREQTGTAQTKGPVWTGRPLPRSYAVAPCGMVVPTRLARRHQRGLCDHG